MLRRFLAGVGGLVLLSFTVRCLVASWVLAHGVPPLHDEATYFALADGWVDLWRGGGDDAWARALGDGRWPPLHPAALALGSSTAGLAGARMIGCLLSALTTGLVYAFGRRLVGSRAARVGAAIHAVAPAFVFYSHSLWSENLALFFAFGGLVLALDARRALGGDGGLRGTALAAAAGVVLGAAVLTRVALAPWAALVPCGLAMSPGPGRRRIRLAAAAAAGAAVVIAPWVAVQVDRYDHLGLSTLGGYNLALGNHAEVPAAYGSSWGHAESTRAILGELRSRADAAGTEWWRPASGLARSTVSADPAAALGRVVVRLWLLAAPDVLPIRHVLHATYPPLSPWMTAFLTGAVVLSHVALLFAGVLGLLTGSAATSAGRLVPWLALAALAPPALSVAPTRVFLPVEALLLPGIGAVAVAMTGGGGWAPPRRASVAAAAVAVLSLVSLPRVVELYWRPSIHSAPAVDAFARSLGAAVIYSDAYRLERAGPAAADDLTIALRAEGRRLAPRPWRSDDGPRRRPWPAGEGVILFDLFADDPRPGAVLEVRTPSGGVLASWRLGADDAWRRPRADGDFTLTWLGGGASPR
ncbi:MAG: glycosyltransferase family 39 protein [Acidobacteriota bacterium]